jgi:hypothetical protein
MATKKSAPQDAIALLKADHRKVEDLFEKYEKSRGKKAEIARQICLELTVHATIEEEIFYPACKEAVEDDKLDEAYVEHDGAKVLIAEISNGSPEDEFYDAKVKVLSEEIKHHVKEEEQRDGIFAQAKASKLDLKALGAQLAARKKELMAKLTKEALPPPLTRTMKDCKIERGAPVN